VYIFFAFFFFVLANEFFFIFEKGRFTKKSKMRMGACVTLAMALACLVPQTGSFAVPSQSLLMRRRGGA